MKLRVSWAVLALVFFISAWAQAATAPGPDCHAIAVPQSRSGQA